MKVKMIGSHLCQDTLFALMKLKDAGVEVDFEDISASFPALKDFLHARDNDPVYETVKAAGGIGIPYFVFEDGSSSLDYKEVLKKL